MYHNLQVGDDTTERTCLLVDQHKREVPVLNEAGKLWREKLYISIHQYVIFNVNKFITRDIFNFFFQMVST